MESLGMIRFGRTWTSRGIIPKNSRVIIQILPEY